MWADKLNLQGRHIADFVRNTNRRVEQDIFSTLKFFATNKKMFEIEKACWVMILGNNKITANSTFFGPFRVKITS